jgi:CubicO group peptidase (beta-lactamase class C family)
MDDFDRGLNTTHLPAGVAKLEWSTKLKDVLPDWSVADQSIYEHLSLRDMLSHVSGFPRCYPSVVRLRRWLLTRH